MSDYGLLEEVRSVRRGSVLTATASIGDSALVVDYGGDFNNDPDDPDNSGGILDLNGARLTYTSVTYGELPDDPDTILLAVPLAAAADIDDSVLVVTGGQIAEDWVAHITMGEGDQVLVPLSVDQRSQWPLGVYADPVPVIVSDDLLHLEDAPGRTTQLRATIWAEDHTTATADDADVVLTLTYTPTPNTLAVFKNGIRLLSSEFDLDGLLVTVPPSTGVTIRTDDDVSAYYEYDADAEAVAVSFTPGTGPELTGLVLRGTTPIHSSPTTMDLHVDTEIGDVIVVASATMSSDASPGSATPDDARLTQISHNTWIGIATTLDPITFTNPDGDRHTASIAVFVPPAAVKNHTDFGPIAGIGGTDTMTAPVAAAAAAVLVVTSENPNGFNYPVSAVPAGYTQAVAPSSGAAVCSAGIWYWQDTGATSSPSGSITYNCHIQGNEYATAVGLNGG